MLEGLHTEGTDNCSPGLLIANDADVKRAHLLIHQSARIPSDKFMVTNLEASRFPWLQADLWQSGRTQRLRFTKILCDVPCSGDGTLRKNPGIWKKWNVGNGNGLHLFVPFYDTGYTRSLLTAVKACSYGSCNEPWLYCQQKTGAGLYIQRVLLIR